MSTKQKLNVDSSGFNFLDMYLKLQILFTSLSFVSVWIAQYFLGTPLNLIEKLSFKVVDPPWLPSNIQPIPILGNHFFGDWQLDTTWAIDGNNPYISEVMPSRTPPLGLFFTSFFGLAGIRIGWIIFAVASLALAFKLFHVCTTSISGVYKYTLFVFVFLLNSSVIVSLDRGSSHILAFAAVGLSVYYFRNNHFYYGTAFYVIATAFKPQFIVMLLFLIGLQKVYKILLLLIFPFVLNLFFMILFYQPFEESFLGYLKGSSLLTTGGGNENAAGIIADSVSIVGFFSRWIEARNGIGGSLSWIQNNGLLFGVISILWLVILILTITFRTVSWNVRVVLILSTASLILPSSGVYTLGWTFVAVFLIILGKETSNPKFQKFRMGTDDIFLAVILISTVTPTFFTDFMISGLSRRLPMSIMYFPALLALVVFVWLREEPARAKSFKRN